MQDLKTRICNGYNWLKENQDHPNYPQALKLYEELVDQLPPNVKESDCWSVDIDDAINIFTEASQLPLDGSK